MSPINEQQLRHELRTATSGAPDGLTLGRSIVERGHRVQRRRAVAGGVAVALVLLGGGAGVLSMLSNRTQTAVPVTSPTASAPVTHTLTTTAPTRSSVPGEFGTLPDSFRLWHEGVAGTGETTPWLPETLGFGCATEPADVSALGELEASRAIGMTGPEMASSEAILVFKTEAAASTFMAEVVSVSQCPPRLQDDPNATMQYREAFAAGTYPGLGDEAATTSDWWEAMVDDAWVGAPGGGVTLFVRSGRAVAVSATGGEYVGDPAATRPDVMAEVQQAIDHALPQMCSWTSAGC